MKRNKRSISLRRLCSLWRQYSEFRKPQIAPSTYKRDYGKIQKRLARLRKEAPEINSAIAVRDWLLKNYSVEITRRTLVQLNAMMKWAMQSEITESNAFDGLCSQLRSPRRSPKAWASFTSAERDVIIQEFDRRVVWASSWVRFLFWTGSRPEEAAALKWDHVSIDNREVLISEAFPVDMHEAQSTKNYKVTRFPCNNRLQGLLRQQRPSIWKADQFVFPGPMGGRFDYHGFQSRHWKPIVRELRDTGRIAFYLPQYNCRHTFITEGLRAGIGVAEMAYLVRTSVHTIHKHYLDRTRSITVPEF